MKGQACSWRDMRKIAHILENQKKLAAEYSALTRCVDPATVSHWRKVGEFIQQIGGFGDITKFAHFQPNHAVFIAYAMPSTQWAVWAADCEKQKWTVKDLRRQLLLAQVKQLTVRSPAGQYATLIADPPWPIEKIPRQTRPAQQGMDYPPMSFEQIRDYVFPDGRRINELGLDHAHLYLWTTHKWLPRAFEIATAWGFRYQCLMTWVKNVGFTPFSWMYSTEHVLFCTRGDLELLERGLRLDFQADVREHSRKPDAFYDLVSRASPAPRIDLFAREPRAGFVASGNEPTRFVSVR